MKILSMKNKMLKFYKWRYDYYKDVCYTNAEKSSIKITR